MKRLLLALLFLASPAVAAETYITTGAVNLRSTPSTKGKVYTTFKKGTKIFLLQKTNKYWSKVEDGHHEGFVSNAYIKPVKPDGVRTPEPTTWERDANSVYALGTSFLGAKYQYGAKPYYANKTFDCSSFIQYIYSRIGVPLPRDSRQQSQKGVAVAFSKMRKGDLIFFKSTRGKTTAIDHVAMYAGDDKLLHTYANPPGVAITKFSGTNWQKRAVSVRRVLQ